MASAAQSAPTLHRNISANLLQIEAIIHPDHDRRSRHFHFVETPLFASRSAAKDSFPDPVR